MVSLFSCKIHILTTSADLVYFHLFILILPGRRWERWIRWKCANNIASIIASKTSPTLRLLTHHSVRIEDLYDGHAVVLFSAYIINALLVERS